MLQFVADICQTVAIVVLVLSWRKGYRIGSLDGRRIDSLQSSVSSLLQAVKNLHERVGRLEGRFR